MKSSRSHPWEKEDRHRFRSGASASRDPAGVEVSSPVFATEARRQSEAVRDGADDGRAFVGSISEFGKP